MNLDDGSGFGDVEALGSGLDGADEFGREVLRRTMGGVDGGELESVEESGGAAGVELPMGEGVDDDGEGDLDGVAVFNRGEFDVLPGMR